MDDRNRLRLIRYFKKLKKFFLILFFYSCLSPCRSSKHGDKLRLHVPFDGERMKNTGSEATCVRSEMGVGFCPRAIVRVREHVIENAFSASVFGQSDQREQPHHCSFCQTCNDNHDMNTLVMVAEMKVNLKINVLITDSRVVVMTIWISTRNMNSNCNMINITSPLTRNSNIISKINQISVDDNAHRAPRHRRAPAT